jgi:hypothetical protein
MVTKTRIDDLYLNAEMSDAERRSASRRVASEELQRCAPGIFTSLPEVQWPALMQRERIRVLAASFPKSVVGYRTAMGATVMGEEIFLNYSYNRTVTLPGMVVHLVKGAGPLPGDQQMAGKEFYFPSEARMLMDNLSIDRSGKQRNAPEELIEERLASICLARGETRLNELRDQARSLAPRLGRDREFRQLDKMIGAILGSRPEHASASPSARALAMGQDKHRIELFDRLVAQLRHLPFSPVPDSAADAKSQSHFAFLESYFSNFIEGTEFEISEARDIVMHGKLVPNRPKDSHDILGVYRQAVHPAFRMLTMPHTDAAADQLQMRHADMMQVRPEVAPGEFKMQANVAGNTRFVDPKLVRGTLTEAVKRLPEVPPGFPRAVLAMFIIAEIHPFNDGNGRLARIMMNAELSHAGEGRIIVPTLLRDEYVDCLRVLTREGDATGFIKVMREAHLWTASFDYSNLDGVIATMKECNAFEKSRAQSKLYAPDGTVFGQIGSHATQDGAEGEECESPRMA